jgi:hypothetical protein
VWKNVIDSRNILHRTASQKGAAVFRCRILTLMFGPHRRARFYVILLILLLVLIGALYFFGIGRPATVRGPFTSRTDIPPGFPQDIPAPTQNDVASAQQSFQALVQYTGSGFHPSTINIKKGDTVRFINTAQNTLTLSISGATTTQTLAHGAYYQVTFTQIGTSSFNDGVIKGTVTVN